MRYDQGMDDANENQPARWVVELGPEVTITKSMKVADGGWTLEARWWGKDANDLSAGPREAIISLAADASPSVRRKGVTSGVMRRLEGALARLIAEWEQTPKTLREDGLFFKGLGKSVEAFPEAGPRSKTGNYYGDLLQLFEEIEVFRPRPLDDLEAVMKIPKNTIKSQMQRARKMREDGVI